MDLAPSPQFSRSERLVIAACAISMLIVQMDWFALNLALPAIARQFDVPTIGRGPRVPRSRGPLAVWPAPRGGAGRG